MGIKNLMKVLSENTPNAISDVKMSELHNSKVAIDTSIIIYQIVTAIRSSGEDLKGPNGKSTSHIHAILSKTLSYLRNGITPIHIFDGKPPEIKMKILQDRLKIKKEAINKLIEINEAEKPIDIDALNLIEDEKIKLLKQSVSISHAEMLEAQEIVQLLGVPLIQAPEEADAQCAYLSANNLVNFVATEDMDLLTFGSKIVIRNFLKKNMCKINLSDVLKDSKLTMDQFIDICILLGCDYTDSIEGIGPKRAWELIVKYGSIENLIAKDKKIAENKYKLPDNFRYVEARDYFKNHRHTEVKETDLILQVPKLNELKKLLIDKYGFDENNIEHMIGFLRKRFNIYDQQYVEKQKQILEKINEEMQKDPFVSDDEAKPKKKSKQKNNIVINSKKK